MAKKVKSNECNGLQVRQISVSKEYWSKLSVLSFLAGTTAKELLQEFLDDSLSRYMKKHNLEEKELDTLVSEFEKVSTKW